MTDRDTAEIHAGLRTLRAILEKRVTPGTLHERYRLIEDEVAELANGIEAIADERDRLVKELRMAQEQSHPTIAISS